MENLLNINVNKNQNFEDVFNSWRTFKNNLLEIRNLNLSDIEKEEVYNKKANILCELAKKFANQGIINFKDEQKKQNLLFKKIRKSKIKDLLFHDAEIITLTSFIFSGLQFNYQCFSNIIFMMERIIRNIFEDCGISSILSEKDGILRYREVSHLFDNLEDVEKVSMKYPSIRIIAFMYKEPSVKLRELLMKERKIDWKNVKIYIALKYMMFFILDIIDIKSETKGFKMISAKKINTLKIEENNIPEIVKNIKEKTSYFTFMERSKILYLLRDKENVLQIRNLMAEITDPEIFNMHFSIDSSEIRRKIYYDEKNSIFSALNLIKLGFNDTSLFNQKGIDEKIFKYIGNHTGALYSFKDDEREIYMSFYLFYLTCKKNYGSMDAAFLKSFIDHIWEDVNDEDYSMVETALLNGFSGEYIFCLNLLPVVKGYRNKVNHLLSNNERVIVDFFMSNKKLDILGNMRHGSIPPTNYDFYGFVLFNIFCLFNFYNYMKIR